MRILCISDTHQRQNKLRLIECDVLLIAGDVCSSGEIWQLENFVKWLSKESDKFRKAYIIAGNHDWCFMKTKTLALDVLKSTFGDKVEYLEDSESIFEGIKFYGTPWQPEFHRWAFNLPRGEKLKSIWDNIPNDVDVLITHGPPHGVGDLVDNTHVGCADLFERIRKLDRLFLHVFGHIHNGNGHYISEATPNVNFCNAAICDEQYEPNNMACFVNLTNVGTHYFITCAEVDLGIKND